MSRRYTAEQFVTNYMKAYKDNITIKELAQRVSLPVDAIRSRTYNLRAKGVQLPKLKSSVGINKTDVEALNKLIAQSK